MSVQNVLLRDIHDSLLATYDWKDSVSPPGQPGTRVRPPYDSQDGLDGPSQQESDPLFCVITTVEDSTLITEMENLESDEEDTSRRVLWYKSMS